MTLKGVQAYVYRRDDADVEGGFAESDLDEYQSVESEVASGRSLSAVRQAFGIASLAEREIEKVWDGFVDGKY